MMELVASACGLACVYLTARRQMACWPTGLVMVVLYAIIFYEAKLYSDMLLQVVYVFLQLYGWWAWLRGGPDGGPLVVTRIQPLAGLAWLGVGAVATAVWGTVMASQTDASYPYVDAGAAVASLIAQWWLGRKILESWWMWIAVDVVSIGLYWAKSLYLTMGLYAVFLVLAIWGCREWRRAWHAQVTG